MSIINKIPDNSRARYPVVRFESSNLAVGEYSFENAGNLKVTIMENLSPNHVYLIERINFFANVSESDWLSSMLAVTDFPRVSLQFAVRGPSSIFAEPFRCVNYVDNAETLIYFRPNLKTDVLTASMFGSIGQVAGMVGMATIVAQFNMAVYEIIDKNWIATYERNPKVAGEGWRV